MNTISRSVIMFILRDIFMLDKSYSCYVFFLAIQYFDLFYFQYGPIVRNISIRKIYCREKQEKEDCCNDYYLFI